jgi:hypothetical protein
MGGIGGIGGIGRAFGNITPQERFSVNEWKRERESIISIQIVSSKVPRVQGCSDWEHPVLLSMSIS